MFGIAHNPFLAFNSQMALIAIIVGGLLIVAFLIWNYKQTTTPGEITTLRTDASNAVELSELMVEKKPVIVSDITPPRVWTSANISDSNAAGLTPLHIMSSGANREVLRITTRNYIRSLREASDASSLNMTAINTADVAKSLGYDRIIEDKTAAARGWWIRSVNPDVYIVGTTAPTIGLTKNAAEWAVIIPTEGPIYATIAHPENERYLPADAKDLARIHIWDDADYVENPLLSEVQTMDIILKPGYMLLIPAHWYFSIRAKLSVHDPDDDTADDGLDISLGLIGYLHSPISKFVSAAI